MKAIKKPKQKGGKAMINLLCVSNSGAVILRMILYWQEPKAPPA